MRRSRHLGLAILAALVVIAGGYTAYWFHVAGQIKDGIVEWAEAARADHIEASWQRVDVAGFPFAFRAELEGAALRDTAITPSPELRFPSLSGTARPWNFRNWQLAAPAGFEGSLAGSSGRAPVQVRARTAQGLVLVSQDGGWDLWLRAQDSSVGARARVRISTADARIVFPSRPPADSRLTLTVNARGMQLPAPVAPLGDTIDALDLRATVKGRFTGGKLAEAAAAWRDAGGAIDLDQLHLKWGGVGATASGTVALDQELQPKAAFSGSVRGYDQILTGLVENGQIRATDAGLARIALGLLAKPGLDGTPEIKTAFAIRDGQMFLGPARLGKAPRLSWE